MKKIIALLFIFIFSLLNVCSQDITGSWSGELDIQGNKLPIVFNIEKNAEGYKATMDSPKQGAKGIPTSGVTFENSTLRIKASGLGVEYEGVLDNDQSITGSFKQGGFSFPLHLIKEKYELNRPQEPQPPFPYVSEDVVFENKTAGVKLAGTLTYPKQGKNLSAVILISGSGAQDRNEEIFAHKPFLVIADYLTRSGIAVLRYDDRGTAQSEGDFTTATTRDFATDARAAFDYLRTRENVDTQKIGFLGHSEGGTIAFMLAAQYDDIAFVISMAGTAQKGDALLYEQRKMIIQATGGDSVTFEKNEDLIRRLNVLIANQTIADVRQNASKYVDELFPSGLNDIQKKQFENQVIMQASPWMQYFLQYDPSEDIAKITCPILAINGEKDLQVGAGTNLTRIKKIAPHAAIKQYPDLNHLFQRCQTGMISEYGEIEETISPEVLKDIADWIR